MKVESKVSARKVTSTFGKVGNKATIRNKIGNKTSTFWKVGRLETRLPKLGTKIERRKTTSLSNKFLD